LIDQFRTNIDNFLKDNFNTKDTLIEICNLISETYNYIKRDNVQYGLIKKIFDYVLHILQSFGLIFENNGNSTKNDQEKFNKAMDILIDYRDGVRKICFNVPLATLASANDKCKERTALKMKKELLKLSDNIRDDKLKAIDIKIEDGTNDGKKYSIWKKII